MKRPCIYPEIMVYSSSFSKTMAAQAAGLDFLMITCLACSSTMSLLRKDIYQHMPFWRPYFLNSCLHFRARVNTSTFTNLTCCKSAKLQAAENLGWHPVTILSWFLIEWWRLCMPAGSGKPQSRDCSHCAVCCLALQDSCESRVTAFPNNWTWQTGVKPCCKIRTYCQYCVD